MPFNNFFQEIQEDATVRPYISDELSHKAELQCGPAQSEPVLGPSGQPDV